MTLFPQLSDTYYVENDHNILKKMDYVYAKDIAINQSYWSEADIDMRFVAGDQSLWNDIYGNLPAFRRRQFNFNRILRIVNMITGHQRQHRKSTVYTPMQNADERPADQFTQAVMWANKKGNILETISEAFEGAVICGMNMLSIWNDYRSDPVNGDLMVDNISYNGFIIDSYFKKADLSDCNNIWVRKYLSKNMCKSLLPGREDEIDGLRGWGNRDGKFQFLPESYNYGQSDLLLYDEFWYLDTRKQTVLCDVTTGETIEWRGQAEDLEEFKKIYRHVAVIEHEIQTTKLAIVVQGKVFYNGPNPLGIDRYPFVPVMAYYRPELPYFPWRLQGVCRGLRDAQYLYNRRRVIELDILESQMSSGFIYKESALVNPKDVFLQGQGKGLALKASAQMSDVMPIQPPQIPPSMVQLSELLAREVQEISGVNEELLGSAIDDKAGILSMLRQGAGLTTLQVLFDNLDRSQRLLGELQMEIIQANWTPGKVKQVIQEEPAPEFYSRNFGKYHCVVEEGLNTSTQRQMQFAQMLQLREVLGDLISPQDLLEAATFQNKDKIIERVMQREQQAQQMAQQQQQVQQQVMSAQVHDLQAKAMANEGLGIERASRVQENRALAIERLAEAQKDRDLGLLDRVKAAKELQGIDLEHLEKALSIIKMLKGQDDEEKAQSEQKDMQKSA